MYSFTRHRKTRFRIALLGEGDCSVAPNRSGFWFGEAESLMLLYKNEEEEEEVTAEQEMMDTSTCSSLACLGLRNATGSDSIFFSVAESHYNSYTSAFLPVGSDFVYYMGPMRHYK